MEKSGFRKEEIFEKRDAAKKAAAKKLEEERGITENKPRSKKQAKKAANAAKTPIKDEEMSVLKFEEMNVGEFEPVQAEPAQVEPQTTELPNAQINEQVIENELIKPGIKLENMDVMLDKIHELSKTADSNGNVSLMGLNKVAKRSILSKIQTFVKGVVFGFGKQEKLKMGASEGKVEISEESIEQI